MVDTFLFLTIARTGDQLQGIKKGVLELADVIAVNKADGPHEADAKAAARELAGALRLLHTGDGTWRPPVLTCSAQQGTGLEELWKQLVRHQETLEVSGELARRRRDQQIEWMWSMVREGLLERLRTSPRVASRTAEVERAVSLGTLTPSAAAERILAAFGSGEAASDQANDSG
jgi:LAO/AO transport system kinase